MIATGSISRPADLDAFLYTPKGTARNGGDWRSAITAVLAVGVLLGGASLLWWWPRRNAAPAGASAGGGGGKPTGGVAAPIAGVPAEMHRKLTAIRTYTLNRLRMLGSHMRLQPGFAGLAAAASKCAGTLEHVTCVASAGCGVCNAEPLGERDASNDGIERGRRDEPAPDRSQCHAGDARSCPPATGPGLRSKCRLSLLPELWLCRTDPDAVATTILDLVTAAVADMPAGGDLIVGTRQYTIDDAAAAELAGSAPGEYVRLTVRDNGPGLSPEGLDRLFNSTETARPAVVAAGELTRRFGGLRSRRERRRDRHRRPFVFSTSYRRRRHGAAAVRRRRGRKSRGCIASGPRVVQGASANYNVSSGKSIQHRSRLL